MTLCARLRQNVWRRMMMRYAPFISALGDKHGEARWTRHRLAIYHPGKRVKTSDFDRVIVDYDCAPFVNRVFVAGSFCGREIRYDRLSALGHNGTDGSEKNCIRTIVLGFGACPPSVVPPPVPSVRCDREFSRSWCSPSIAGSPRRREGAAKFPLLRDRMVRCVCHQRLLRRWSRGTALCRLRVEFTVATNRHRPEARRRS